MHSETNKNLDHANQTVSDHEKRLQDMEGSILLLKGMSSSGSGPSDDNKSGIIDALNAMIDKLRAEC